MIGNVCVLIHRILKLNLLVVVHYVQIRFMPEDITDLLPQFFDLEKTDDGDYRENKKFVENERQKQVYRNQIKGKLMDSEYERFRELNAK